MTNDCVTCEVPDPMESRFGLDAINAPPCPPPGRVYELRCGGEKPGVWVYCTKPDVPKDPLVWPARSAEGCGAGPCRAGGTSAALFGFAVLIVTRRLLGSRKSGAPFDT